MTVAAASFLFPTGELRPEMLSATEEELLGFIATWATEGAEAADGAGLTGAKAAAVVEATIYARGFRAAVDGLLSMPASSRLPDGNQYGYTDEQFTYWQGRAAYWEGQQSILLQGERRSAPAIPGTVAVPVRWVL